MKRLSEALSKHKQSAASGYTAPFKQQVEWLGRFVFGEGFGVTLNKDLEIVERTLNGQTLDVDWLSGGAREHLGVLCRLACASITSADRKGAPVDIDDALGWSDKTRLEPMCRVIDEAGKKCQVIILTCMPGRYSNVGKAETAHL